MTDLDRHVAEYIEAAKATVEGVTPGTLRTAVDAGEVTVVDVREAPELAAGAIPGAIHAPRGGIEYSADPESEYYREGFDPAGRYVCHCAGGSRGALAAARLHEMGYEDVAYLEGGFRAWEAAGHPVEAVDLDARLEG